EGGDRCAVPELAGGQDDPGEQDGSVNEPPAGPAHQLGQPGRGQRWIVTAAGHGGGGDHGEHCVPECGDERDPGAAGTAELEQFRGDERSHDELPEGVEVASRKNDSSEVASVRSSSSTIG